MFQKINQLYDVFLDFERIINIFATCRSHLSLCMGQGQYRQFTFSSHATMQHHISTGMFMIQKKQELMYYIDPFESSWTNLILCI
jgi:hypothetical protein